MVVSGKLGFSESDYRLFVKVLRTLFVPFSFFRVFPLPAFKQPALGSSIPACLKEATIRVVRYIAACFLGNCRLQNKVRQTTPRRPTSACRKAICRCHNRWYSEIAKFDMRDKNMSHFYIYEKKTALYNKNRCKEGGIYL